MTKLVTFIAVLVAMASVMFLSQYKSLPVNNDKFSFEEAKAAYIAEQERRERLEEARLARLNPPEEQDFIVVEELPLVDLNTAQLVKGHELYQRCIVCHGRQGEGRLSQNSPAIGGQYDWYILSSLQDMKEGRRVNALMNPYLRNLDNDDFVALADYLSRLPWRGAQR
jgi:cytochrome c553